MKIKLRCRLGNQQGSIIGLVAIAMIAFIAVIAIRLRPGASAHGPARTAKRRRGRGPGGHQGLVCR